MNITLSLSSIQTRIRQYFTADSHVQTSNTGLVALVAICMMFVAFVSNKPGSMAPLLQANIQNAMRANAAETQRFIPENARTIVLNGTEYYLIPKNP